MLSIKNIYLFCLSASCALKWNLPEVSMRRLVSTLRLTTGRKELTQELSLTAWRTLRFFSKWRKSRQKGSLEEGEDLCSIAGDISERCRKRNSWMPNGRERMICVMKKEKKLENGSSNLTYIVWKLAKIWWRVEKSCPQSFFLSWTLSWVRARWSGVTLFWTQRKLRAIGCFGGSLWVVGEGWSHTLKQHSFWLPWGCMAYTIIYAMMSGGRREQKSWAFWPWVEPQPPIINERILQGHYCQHPCSRRIEAMQLLESWWDLQSRASKYGYSVASSCCLCHHFDHIEKQWKQSVEIECFI